jgi:hypothetical protein
MSKTPTQTKSKPADDGRGPQGKFTPGVSGNPSGRPKSESVALRESLATGAASVVKAVLEAAKAGDMTAARIVLDRILPPLKASAAHVSVNLPASFTPLDAGTAFLAAAASGELAPDIASSLVSAAGTLARVQEIQELADRLEALEKATRPISSNKKTKP